MLEEVQPDAVLFDGTWPFHGFMDACKTKKVPLQIWSNRGLHKKDFEPVPVSESELPNWVTSPFVAEVKDGKLWGRGSGDMKGGVTAFLLAFRDIEIEKGNVVIALSGDEEIGGPRTRREESRWHRAAPA